TPHSVFNVNDELKVMIIDLDAERGRISLSTKQLEPEPGAMLKNRDLVYEKAEEMAEKYRQKLLAEAEGRPISEEVLDIPPALEDIEDEIVSAVED
ncbi:MAG: 30S ribosomal protein S1, partial [Microcystaceae cyanobacterium]